MSNGDVKIIGLAGTLAAGKDTVGHILEKKYGFFHASTSDMLRAAKRKAFGDSPEALLLRNDPFANELRVTRGPGILTELAIEDYASHKKEYPGGLVISGIRSIGEVESLHKAGGVLIFVDADPRVRYARVAGRGRDKNDTNTSFEEFIASENSERSDSREDKTIQNLTAVKEMADIQFENDGNNLDSFEEEVTKKLEEIVTR